VYGCATAIPAKTGIRVSPRTTSGPLLSLTGLS
jgi:hypothetical protein